jgi:vacuolar protein sorting-associated protein 13A/C
LHGNKPLSPEDQAILQKLELELSYEDIRFFRSVARSQARKDAEVRRLLEEEKKHQQVKQGGSGWLGWVWGSSASNETAADGEPHITEADRQQLNEIIDYDASAALVHTELPRDFLLTKVTANLRKGSLSLRSGPHGRNAEIISLVFDSFGADVTQLTDSLDAFISLGDFRVYDGTMPNTLHSQIVRVKDSAVDREKSQLEMQELGRSRPFFTVRLEHNPLDRRADNGITVKMRHLEIIYHRGYVDAVFKFFKPPSSQLESIGALLDAAGQTLDELRRETRAGLEYALEQHRTVDMRVDMNAPIIIVPEDPTTKDCLHLVLDAGHIAISSALADKEAMQRIQAKRGQQYSEDDFQELEQLMYDRFSLRLESTQVGFILNRSDTRLTCSL